MRRGCAILVLVAALGGHGLADDAGAPTAASSIAPIFAAPISIAQLPAAALAPVEPPAEAPRSLARRPWFWIALGGAAAVIAAGVALAVVYGHPRDPTASFGVVVGN
ncbi:MAG TPA: hypothetical protein VFF06_05455 [Polyangia bacterium]|nr:hypothetical protein [Polyangia bacterium]